MFGKLKAKLEDLLSALEDRSGSDPGDDITRLLAGMHAVKAPLGTLPKLCNLEHQWLAEDLILRGDLIHDRQTVAAGSSDNGRGVSNRKESP
jgi:hypothetical protein